MFLFLLFLTEWNSLITFYRTPLHYAAEKGSLDLVQFILKQKGVYINETTNSISILFFRNGVSISYIYLSALHYSAERNKVEVVEYLLSDANINAGAQDIKGFCAKGIQFINGKYIYSP